jgi:hypothetical protein
MFSIRFTDEPLFDPEPGEIGRVGLLQFGFAEERFVSHLWNWAEQDYSAHWKRALSRTLEGKPSALITDMRTPSQSSHLVWWPIWRVQANLVFHHQLFFFSQHAVESLSGDVETLFDFVGDRRTHDSENNQISEWIVPASAVELFLSRK